MDELPVVFFISFSVGFIGSFFIDFLRKKIQHDKIKKEKNLCEGKEKM